MKSNKFLFSALTIGLGLLTACSSEDIVSDIEGFSPEGTTTFAMEAPEQNAIQTPQGVMRTKMFREIGKPGKFIWMPGDHLYVERSVNDWVPETSNTIPAGGIAAANFFYQGTYANPSYNVFYNGTIATSGSPQMVEIAAKQVQAAPNDFSHLASSGDCGYAVTTKLSNGVHKFNIKHLPVYFAVLPRTTDPKLEGGKVQSVQLNTIGLDYLSGRFRLTPDSLRDTGGFANSFVKVETADSNGFPLYATNNASNPSAYYMVANSGKHALRARFVVKATNGATYYINKVINETSTYYKKGTIYDITSNLIAMPAGLEKYYTWDAATNRYMYADEGTKIITYPDINVDQRESVADHAPIGYADPSGNNDTRAYSKSTSRATRTAANSPTYNELSWIVWAAMQPNGGVYYERTQTYQHLGGTRKGGFWIPKASYIKQLNQNQDLKTTTAPGFSSNAIPSATPRVGTPPNPANYYFVPAYGYIEPNGQILGVGAVTRTWSSDPYTGSTDRAFSLSLEFTAENKKVELSHQNRACGMTLWQIQ